MTNFDPARHYIVARINDTEDPDFRQEVHVELGDLIGEARKMLAEQARELVPQPSTAVIEVPAFEERKVAALESRLATALARIDELEARPAISGRDLEDIRRAMSGRIQELIKDEVHAALSQHVAMRELRETIDRVSKETAPSKIMETISRVSTDVANLHASTADTLQVVEAVVAETREQMHTCMADALKAVQDEMEQARQGFRADMISRLDSAFSKRSA